MTYQMMICIGLGILLLVLGLLVLKVDGDRAMVAINDHRISNGSLQEVDRLYRRLALVRLVGVLMVCAGVFLICVGGLVLTPKMD